jgi:hypothetical protein
MVHLTWLVTWLSCLPCRIWCNIIIIMDEALMPVPAALPTAQPRANVDRYFNAKTGKGMRMAKARVSDNSDFESFQAHASGTEGCL